VLGAGGLHHRPQSVDRRRRLPGRVLTPTPQKQKGRRAAPAFLF
jgi:hypothetical protein